MREVVIRPGRVEDLEQAADLVVRLKRLNEEFDPILKVSSDAVEKARGYIREALGDDRKLLLVAEAGGKVVGLLKADITVRDFYEPKTEGAIREFYILPEHRRKRLGEEMVLEATKHLRDKGAWIITAEFPTQNIIAVNFYKKLGFRSIISLHATTLPITAERQEGGQS